MKTKTTGLLVLLISILLVIAGCSSEPVLCADCIPFTFKQTFLKKFQDNDIFFIKGVASDVYKHGREIKVIEDLKGNFNGKTSIFVWGMSSTSFCDNKGRQDMRVDDIVQYHENDTLIMFIEKTRKSFDNDNEKPSDYATISCHPSILKLSNGYVTGDINYWWRTVLWEELQAELKTLLYSDEKPFWWRSEEYIPDPFVIAFTGVSLLEEYYTVDYFFIKGVVLESYQDYGKRIQIIIDLKGNFSKETTTFIIWGTTPYRSEKFDNLSLYNHLDTLLMLLTPITRYTETLLEKRGDYTTLNCAFSVLKLSNNSVNGYITSCYKGIENITMEEFQALLNSVKKSKL